VEKFQYMKQVTTNKGTRSNSLKMAYTNKTHEGMASNAILQLDVMCLLGDGVTWMTSDWGGAVK